MLILAPYPHPDIGALRQAISRLPYFQTEVVVASTAQRLSHKKRYDVALLYDAYTEESLLSDYAHLQEKGTACWWFLSTRSKEKYMPKEISTWGRTSYRANFSTARSYASTLRTETFV